MKIIFLKSLKYIKKMYMNYINKEHKQHGIGNIKNKDKNFYLIRCNMKECGYFALLTFVLDHLAIAEARNLIPVVDMESYKLLYTCEEYQKNKNVWEYFYLPVSPFSVEIIKKSKNVVLSEMHFPHYKAIYYNDHENVLPSAEQIRECNRILFKYTDFNEEVYLHLKKLERLISKEKKILGIHIRGTDMYTEGKQHPKPNERIKDLEYIKKVIKNHDIEEIFLCTDSESSIKKLQGEFGDKLITTNAIRQTGNSCIGLHKDKSLNRGRTLHEYNLGIEVISDMYLLSRCNVLLCGPSNVAFFAMIYNNNKYEKIYYWS